jgi:hypothetical protein
LTKTLTLKQPPFLGHPNPTTTVLRGLTIFSIDLKELMMV